VIDFPNHNRGRLDESGFLKAFDSNRDLICAAPARIYVRGSRGSYYLVAASFRNNFCVSVQAMKEGHHMRRPSQRIGLRRYGIWGGCRSLPRPYFTEANADDVCFG
jgi:hypothetical protein